MFFLTATAARLYCIGSIFMTLSEGYERVLPTWRVCLCFAGEATLQIWRLSRNPDLGVPGLLVSTLDPLCTVLFGIFVFKEGYST